MKKLFLSLLITAGVISAGTPSSVENFSLNDYNGKTISLTDYKEAKAIVLMFISTQCPVSNAYNERMASLYNDYTGKDIAILGINSNKAETTEDIKEHAQEQKFGFPILKDINNVIADKLQANHTPEIFIIHPTSFAVLYHGRIDDSQREAKVQSKDLRAALDEIIAGKQVSNKETKAFGCSIKRVN
ncbi:MAG: thioredoxin family protein [Bacteroidota bacterium]|nr:thioredoxin family protein [Bacteroidota bacterium]